MNDQENQSVDEQNEAAEQTEQSDQENSGTNAAEEEHVDADKVVEKLQKRLGHEQAQKNDYKEQLDKALARISKLEKGEDPDVAPKPDEKDAQIKELQAQIKRSETKQQTRSVLTEAGLNVSEDVLNMVVVDDDKTTFSRAKALINYTTSVQDNIRQELMKGVTPRNHGHKTKTVNKSSFDQMTAAERVTLAKEDPAQFKKLTGGL